MTSYLATACTHLLVLALTAQLIHTELAYVYILYRHGDRSPTHIFPTDNHTVDVTWPDGLGWLTTEGIRQHYTFGQQLRRRYVIEAGFLSGRYNHTEVHVRATDVPRTLMSAEANLAGMYPPNGSQVWHADIPWQPIPVHTVAKSKDALLGEAKCERALQLKHKILTSGRAKRVEEHDRRFFHALSTNAGMRVTMENLGDLYDTLYCERAHNLTLPDWVTDEVWNRLEHYNDLTFQLQYNNSELRRFKSGVLIQSIVENFKNIRSGGRNATKMTIYSAHDTTVMPLLATMGLFSGHWVHYTAAVFVELHRTTSQPHGGYYVRVWYRNSSFDDALVPMSIPKCGENCSLDRFEGIVARYFLTPDTYWKVCAVNASTMRIDFQILITVGAVLFAMSAVLGVVMFIRSRRPRRQLQSSDGQFMKFA